MRELHVAEQRYQAVMAVIGDGLSISQVAEKVGVSRLEINRVPVGSSCGTSASRAGLKGDGRVPARATDQGRYLTALRVHMV
jgi:hypothetical protein